MSAAAENPFDGWRSLGVALAMCLVGYGVLVGIPVISTAWVEFLGLSEEQVGRVAGADLGGLRCRCCHAYRWRGSIWRQRNLVDQARVRIA